MNAKSVLLIAATALMAPLAQADNDRVFECTNGAAKRTITIDYATTESRLPCEVFYEKSTGSERLWNAQSQLDYCETKAFELLEKHAGWGWNCTERKSSTEPEPATQAPEVEAEPVAATEAQAQPVSSREVVDDAVDEVLRESN